MNWPITLAGAWIGLYSVSEVKDLLPASFWFEPGMMHVMDTVSGECPQINFTRIIKRQFHGEWLVTLQVENQERLFSVSTDYGPWSGSVTYVPGTVLPEPLTFDWWADIREFPACDWEPGVYRVVTEWAIQPGGNTHYTSIISNPFTVTAKPN